MYPPGILPVYFVENLCDGGLARVVVRENLANQKSPLNNHRARNRMLSIVSAKSHISFNWHLSRFPAYWIFLLNFSSSRGWTLSLTRLLCVPHSSALSTAR